MTYTPFKTIHLGNKKEVLEKLKEKKYYVSPWAQELIDKTEFSSKKQELALVTIQLRDWFGKTYPTTQEIYERAEKEGLFLCPAEVGLILRTEYDGDDRLFIGMKPIIGSDGNLDVFYLGRGGVELLLGADDAEPTSWWSADCGFVFSLRKIDTLKPSDPSALSDTLTLRVQTLEADMEKIKKFLII